jgi:signal transduction histidine kinase
MALAGASAGALVWASLRKPAPTALVIRNGELSIRDLPAGAMSRPGREVFLYDALRGRALLRDANGNLRPADLTRHTLDTINAGIPLHEGLSAPVFTERGEGRIYLENVPGLSIDHLRIGPAAAASVATKVERRALMKAAEESAESRSRLAVARDLHDSVVQFLAGAAFRLEALKRSEASGRELAPELNELKDLMLQEQGELRSFIAALRGGAQTDLGELAKDLQSLANRLARQWDIQCTFSADAGDFPVAARLHLDAQQLVREAVANAVRHAGAKNVSIRLGGRENRVNLDLINDGAAYPRTETGQRMPKSLKERVEAAGGAIDLSRGMGVTRVSISLPATGRAA